MTRNWMGDWAPSFTKKNSKAKASTAAGLSGFCFAIFWKMGMAEIEEADTFPKGVTSCATAIFKNGLFFKYFPQLDFKAFQNGGFDCTNLLRTV